MEPKQSPAECDPDELPVDSALETLVTILGLIAAIGPGSSINASSSSSIAHNYRSVWILPRKLCPSLLDHVTKT